MDLPERTRDLYTLLEAEMKKNRWELLHNRKQDRDERDGGLHSFT